MKEDQIQRFSDRREWDRKGTDSQKGNAVNCSRLQIPSTQKALSNDESYSSTLTF